MPTQTWWWHFQLWLRANGNHNRLWLEMPANGFRWLSFSSTRVIRLLRLRAHKHCSRINNWEKLSRSVFAAIITLDAEINSDRTVWKSVFRIWPTTGSNKWDILHRLRCVPRYTMMGNMHTWRALLSTSDKEIRPLLLCEHSCGRFCSSATVDLMTDWRTDGWTDRWADGRCFNKSRSSCTPAIWRPAWKLVNVSGFLQKSAVSSLCYLTAQYVAEIQISWQAVGEKVYDRFKFFGAMTLERSILLGLVPTTASSGRIYSQSQCI